METLTPKDTIASGNEVKTYLDLYKEFPWQDKKTDCGFKIGDRVPYNSPGTGGVKYAIIQNFKTVDGGNVWWQGFRADKPEVQASSPCFISRILTQL